MCKAPCPWTPRQVSRPVMGMGRGWRQVPSQPAIAAETPRLYCWDSWFQVTVLPASQENCVIRSGMEQGPYLMGKWHFCSPNVLTAWKEGKNPPMVASQWGGECQKDEEPEPQLLIFLYLCKNFILVHFSWVQRTKCLASLMPAGESEILTWPGCWEGSHSHCQGPDLSRAWKESTCEGHRVP